MLLFVDRNDVSNTNYQDSKTIIPVNRVYDIVVSGCRIIVNYDGGDLVEIEGTYQKRIDSVSVVFDSPDKANKVIRQFYKACNSGSLAFYFGSKD